MEYILNSLQYNLNDKEDSYSLFTFKEKDEFGKESEGLQYSKFKFLENNGVLEYKTLDRMIFEKMLKNYPDFFNFKSIYDQIIPFINNIDVSKISLSFQKTSDFILIKGFPLDNLSSYPIPEKYFKHMEFSLELFKKEDNEKGISVSFTSSLNVNLFFEGDKVKLIEPFVQNILKEKKLSLKTLMSFHNLIPRVRL